MGRSEKRHGSRGQKRKDGHDGRQSGDSHRSGGHSGDGHHSGGHGGGGNRGDGGRGDGHRRGGDGTGGRGEGGRRGARDDGEDQRRRERVRDELGRYDETVDHDDVLAVFDAVEGPVVTTTDVGDVVGITTQAARDKLNELVGDGVLRRRKTGRTVVYWETEERDSDDRTDG